MNRGNARLRGLIHALDDSREFDLGIARKAMSPHIKYLLERAARTHLSIADDLAARVSASGGHMQRNGTRRRRLRTFFANWRARMSPEIETAYVTQARKCEARLLRRFRHAKSRTRNAEMREQLSMHQYRLEYALMEIDSLESLMPTQPYTDVISPGIAVVHDPLGIPAQAATAPLHDRFEA